MTQMSCDETEDFSDDQDKFSDDTEESLCGAIASPGAWPVGLFQGSLGGPSAWAA